MSNFDTLLDAQHERRDHEEQMVQALELLHTVWLELGAYDTGELTEQTLNQLNDFFDFDDSE